ncbi:MAG: kinase-like domain-containing protein [Benjaminiella poitrasii]|nr:MAG: kinase-like domain-containing protein [Benjaminiella poitrasii]
MAFMTYLARHIQPGNQTNTKSKTSSSINKRSNTQPTTVPKKKKEIGEYILCTTIGRGASGRVKLGIHKSTGEKVAIKMISRSHLTTSSHTAKSVQRELAVLQLLHHPHLVRLRQVLQDNSHVYFVMDYVEGGELFHVLANRGRLPESEARHLFSQLVSALAWCHSHHISHRDLKPENILLDKEKKNLKVADFGMAAMQPPNLLLSTSCGSPHYASPEIVKGKKYDGKATDVWSCGVILYAMMTGHLPFDDEHMGRLLAKIKTGRYRPLPDYLSSDAKDLIKRMLAVNPTKRMMMTDILYHPWLTNKSFLGTDLKIVLQQQLTTVTSTEFDPLQDPGMELPLIAHKSDLDGRIWETLKVLWRERSEEDLFQSLSAYGCNVQKLTCKLLQERSLRLEQHQAQSPPENCSSISLSFRRSSIMTDDVLMTPPLRALCRGGLEDIESYILTAPYESSLDTMPCSRTLDLFPLTPKSTSTFQQTHIATSLSSSTVNMELYKRKAGWDQSDKNGDTYSLVNPITQQQNRYIIPTTTQSLSSSPCSFWAFGKGVLVRKTEENVDTKSKTADVFVMSQPVESSHNSALTHHVKFWQLLSLDKKGRYRQQQQQANKSYWWNKAHDYFVRKKAIEKAIVIECFAKNECEAAGKLHQVLEEVRFAYIYIKTRTVLECVEFFFFSVVLQRTAYRSNVSSRKDSLERNNEYKGLDFFVLVSYEKD